MVLDAKTAGYRFMTHGGFWEILGSGGFDPSERYMLIRHDVDTDPRTALAMHDVLHTEGFASSFFFRLSTFDVGLARHFDRCGSEVGYHYEELATLAKRRGRGDTTDWRSLLQPSREAFIKNVDRLRASSGLGLQTVASHGDFANRRLGVMNTVILEDPETRRRARIVLEAYDEALSAVVTSRHSDKLASPHWTGESADAAIARGEHVIYILVHPGNWQARPAENAHEDVTRLFEGARFRLKLRGHRALLWEGIEKQRVQELPA